MKIIKKEIILGFYPNGYVSNVYLLLKISLRLERIERGDAGWEKRFLCSHLLCFQGKFQCFRFLPSHVKEEKNKILVPGTGASNVFLSDMLGTGELYF